MSDIERWLQDLGLEKYVEILASHGIDLTVIPDLTEQYLDKLGCHSGTAATPMRAPDRSGLRSYAIIDFPDPVR
jgi:hypothetical protein